MAGCIILVCGARYAGKDTVAGLIKAHYPDWELIDLGVAHPTSGSWPMLDDIHPANTCGLHKTILIAQELERLLGTR